MAKRYVSLLRGINVGASKRISKEALVELYAALGFTEIEVFIQSGNVMFTAASGSPRMLAKKITSRFLLDYAFRVPVVILKPSELAGILRGNPFGEQAEEDPSKVLIGFYADKPDVKKAGALSSRSYAPVEFRVEKDAIYLFCPEGMGKAKLPNFEKELGCAVTFRNARVVGELVDM